jgi:hypothetical protein
VLQASDESVEVMNRLWKAAEKGSIDLAQTVRKFAWLVLEWTSQNLPEKSNGKVD